MVQLSEKSDKNIVGPNFFDLKLFWVMCTGFQRPEHKCFCLSTLLLCCREKSSYYKRILLLLLWLLSLSLFCFREKSSYYKRTYGHWSGLRPPPWALSTEIKWLEIFYLFIYPNKIQKNHKMIIAFANLWLSTYLLTLPKDYGKSKIFICKCSWTHWSPIYHCCPHRVAWKSV